MLLKTSRKLFAHIDCDSFFASCEILKTPSLKGKYVCVGQDIIVAATYNAKALGVKTGTPIWEARKILRGKNPVFCGVDHTYYQQISELLMQYLRKHTLDVRVFSIDEAFCDITGLPELFHLSPSDFVQKLQQEILEQIGIPVSIGVSNTRLKAKIFSKVNKPFGICAPNSWEEQSIFSQNSFRMIPFIGSQTAKKLDFRIQTIAQYLQLGYFAITREFGKNGGRLWLELRWVEVMQFSQRQEAKSIGRARAFHHEQSSDASVLLEKLQQHLHTICWQLFVSHQELRYIEVLLIDSEWRRFKQGKHLEDYESDRQELLSHVESLFWQIYKPGNIYRKTGVFCYDLRSKNSKQLSLFSEENTRFFRSEKLEQVMLEMEGKFGKRSVRIGAR